LTSVSLGNGRTISTVRFGERILLVGSTAQNFTLLAEEALKPAETSLLQTRSVAELLDEEVADFDAEFERAEARLDLTDGGRI
jgi:flagellar biogenesis protein FliO